MKKQDKKNGAKSTIIVNAIQMKNPIIKEFFFEYAIESNIPCDFKISEKYYCYYLSLKYHGTFPTYFEDKLKDGNNECNAKGCIRILFCMFDMNSNGNEIGKINSLKNDTLLMINLNLIHNELENENNFFDDLNKEEEARIKCNNEKVEQMLTNLNMICLNTNVTLILCFSAYDISQYIYSLSQMNNTLYGQGDMRVTNKDDELLEALSIVDKINKTDACTLLTHFKDIRSICGASRNLLSLVPKLNTSKIDSLVNFFEYNFSHVTENS